MSKNYTPHKYQEKAIEFIVSRSNAGLFLAPGLGKTSITLAAFKILKKCGFADKMLIIAPLRPCYSVWPTETKKWEQFTGLSVGVLHGPHKLKVLNAKHDIYVINPEGLRWLFTTLRANMPFDMLVVDECFPRGTRVKTPTGHIEIQDVQVGDVICNALGTGRVVRVGKRPAKKLVKLVTESGVIISTPEHPFFTTKGWVHAKDCGGQEILDYECVSNLRNNVRSSSLYVGEGLEVSLLKILLEEADVGAPSRVAGSCIEENVRDTNGIYTVEQGGSLVSGSCGETSNSSKEQQSTRIVSEDSTGEWNRANTLRSSAGCVAARGISVESGNTIGETRSGLSNELQSGSGEPGFDDRRGGGWGKPQLHDAASAGCQEAEEARGARVVCIENIEHGAEVDVWNLEVEGHPSYFAEGFLVHNCSKFKNTNTDRFKTLKPYLPKFKRRVILTGSPAPNSLLDIFGQMYILDLGKTLSPYISHFRARFFNKRTFEVRHPNPTKAAEGETLVVTDWYITPEKATVLYDHIAPCVLRMSAEDHLDIPPLIINDIYIDLPPKARLIYDQFESAMRLDFKAGKVTAANAAIRGMKARQIANGGIFLDDSGKSWEDIHFAKAEVVQELVEELEGSPALIAYEFRHDLARLKKTLGEATPHIGGGVKGKQAQEIIDAWNRGEIPALLGQPSSMAHGLNMQESGDTVIYHSMVWNFEEYEQFIKRVHRQGKKRQVTLHRIIARDTVDEAVVAGLARKDANQSSLFDAIMNYWR